MLIAQRVHTTKQELRTLICRNDNRNLHRDLFEAIGKKFVPQTSMLDKNSTSSIAVFRALQLGDMLCIIPTIRSVRAAFPNATITLIGLPWQRDFVKRFPNYFDDFVEFPGWPGLPEISWNAEKCTEFLQLMQQRKFDLVLQMQGNGILTNSMCLLWNGKLTAGLRKSTEMVSKGLYVVSDDQEHEVLRFLKIADVLNIERQGSDLEFPINSDEVKEFDKACDMLGIQSKKYVCIHPGARDPKRRWSTSNFASVATVLHSHGYPVVITGSTSESQIIEELQVVASTPMINTVEKLGDYGVGLLAALVDNCKLLVSNDTGVSHIAAARKVPSVIIFSPYSDKNRWAPLNSALHIAVSSEQATRIDEVISAAITQLQLTDGIKDSSQ
jgi:ADP-heptose:LPS heptosyltransferase